MKTSFHVLCLKHNLPLIRQYTEKFLDERGVSTQDKDDLILAMDECCANAIIHGHSNNPGELMKITLSLRKGTFTVRIQNIGSTRFEATETKPIDDLIKQRAKGGLGLRIIHSVMDSVHFRWLPEKSICIMKKQLGPLAVSKKTA